MRRNQTNNGNKEPKIYKYSIW